MARHLDFIGALGSIARSVARSADAQALRAANTLAGAIADAAPKRKGNLARSVRVEKLGGGYVVRAGGELTTKPVRNGASQSYDYSLATEFGTQKEVAEPFFYSTFNRMREPLLEQSQQAIGEAVNN